MKTRISLLITTAGILFTPSGAVVAQTPQTTAVSPVDARRAFLAAKASHDPRKWMQYLSQKASSGALSFMPQGTGSSPLASNETVLYNFESNAPQGNSPQAGVIQDQDGNLYGTTSEGGVGFGVVYKLSLAGQPTALYSFTGGADGSSPQAGVMLDSAGNLYGTTVAGGDLNACGGRGCGVVFKLDKSGKERVLYAFTNSGDGAYPNGSLVLDKLGNIYGITWFGGDLNACPSPFAPGCGVVFKLDKFGNETILHTFTGGSDGAYPNGSLVLDNMNNLYGAAGSGGDLTTCSGSGCGVLFKLDKSGNETVLHTFTGGTDGAYPNGGLILDQAGALYGTAAGGGNLSACFGSGCGVVFKLDKSEKESVLFSFNGGVDGASPLVGVVRDNAGNFFGTTLDAGDLSACYDSGCGVVFKLNPAGKETVLHTFMGLADGGDMIAGVALDCDGNLYGTTSGGGSLSFGTVFKLDPTGDEKVYAFPSSHGGSITYAGLVRDSAGDLYGTTVSGGDANLGVVFKLDAFGRETVLHTFTGGSDGRNPEGGVILDPSGNLYGTTSIGGDLTACGGRGCGVVFKLDKSGEETVLHTFSGGTDGTVPGGSLVLDNAGQLYGVAGGGGNLSLCNGGGCGVVFSLDTSGKQTVLYTFSGGADGAFPTGSLIRDAAGNLYGTTVQGGNPSGYFGFGGGVVFKLDASGKETVLYAFTGGADGNRPLAGLIRDAAGNLYGTTAYGGGAISTCTAEGGCGVVFKLDSAGNETVLHSFTGGSDGGYLNGSLLRDSAGNLFGTTYGGGVGNFGIVFKVDTSHKLTVLHTFDGTDGANPTVGLISDSAGNLYGTASNGGRDGGGVAFRISQR